MKTQKKSATPARVSGLPNQSGPIRAKTLLKTCAAFVVLAQLVPAAEPYSYKKGIGFQAGKGLAYQANILHLTNVSWYYDWGIPTARNTLVDPAIEFVPMVWWGNGLPNPTSEAASAAKIAGLNVPGFYPVENLLGFNEPDHVGQADMEVPEVVAAWPSLENIARPGNLALSSAAMTGFHTEQQQFMTTALATGLKVDFMTFHDYPGWATSFNGAMNTVQQFYNAYGKDVWITEYNMADWAGTAGYTLDQGYTWIAESLYRLEESPIVTRYAIFPWDTSHAAGYASAVLNPGTTASLTPIGELYGDYRTADVKGPYARTWYYLHNKSSRQRLTNGPAFDTIYQKSNSVNFSLVPAGNGNHYIVNKLGV
jgi:Glycosyl hydrolase catalytic core